LDLGEGSSITSWFIEPSAQGFRLHRRSEREPDVTLGGNLADFIRLARTGVAVGDLKISGDVELGSRFKSVLAQVDLDWEEPIARVVGDVAAHQIGRAIRGVGKWGAYAARSIGMNTAEYLQEELRVLAPRGRIETFLRAVDQLRLDADRLDVRLQKLKERAR
jgi:ubiquinone biosynthesis protein UbiJ